jgi:hypothetical protein
MKPRIFTAILLFISAYSPLFLILAVKDFDFQITHSFKHPIADYILLGIVFVSILLLFITVSNMKRGSMAVKVKSVKSRSLDTINYTIPYLFSAFDIDLSKPEDIITISLFMLILLILTITSQSVFINPLLSLNGYAFYDLEYEFDNKTNSTIVISKYDLQIDKQYYIRSLTRFLYFVTERKQHPNDTTN